MKFLFFLFFSWEKENWVSWEIQDAERKQKTWPISEKEKKKECIQGKKTSPKWKTVAKKLFKRNLLKVTLSLQKLKICNFSAWLLEIPVIPLMTHDSQSEAEL